jgi:hypothetical protein
MDEIAPGLLRWTVPHPDWEPSDGGPGGWEPDVACLRLDSAEGVVLIDPLVADGDPDAWEALDPSGRPGVTVVITLHWHLRSAGEVAKRHGARLWANEHVANRLGEAVTDVFEDGDRLPGGIVGLGPVPVSAHETEGLVEEAALWLPHQRAIVVGDLLVGTAEGLRIWWSDRGDPLWEGRVVPFVRRLAELSAAMVLPAHGEPVLRDGRAELERALEAPAWAR